VGTDELAVALVDCDHLKKVNDNFGHLMGDEFVRRISEVLRHALRGSDELGRYGGDEFLAVLPDAHLEHVRHAMDRARARVEQAGLDSEDGLLLSVSIGAVVRGRTDLSREKLLKLADYALYRAKEFGRNAVIVIDAENPPDLSL
jgi:diguanylate cyclase